MVVAALGTLVVATVWVCGVCAPVLGQHPAMSARGP